MAMAMCAAVAILLLRTKEDGSGSSTSLSRREHQPPAPERTTSIGTYDVHGKPTHARRSNPANDSSAPTPLATFDAFRADCWSQCGSQCLPSDSEEITCPSTCNSDDECDADELCTATRSLTDGSRPHRCLKDQCSGPSSHNECGNGQSCVYRGRMEGGIYLCQKAGLRKAGDPCAHDEYLPIGLCERGLHCSNDVCVLDICETDDDCGLGARCNTNAGGDGVRSCTPICEADIDCPQGTTCDDHTTSSLLVPPRCTSPANMGCLSSPCDDGLECIVNKDQGSYAITSCMRPCAPDNPCGGTEICSDAGYCHALCDESTPCPEGWQCYTDPEDDVSACARDTDTAEQRLFQTLSTPE